MNDQFYESPESAFLPEAPILAEGDLVHVAAYPGDLFVVTGLRAHGMLVDCLRHGDGQVFCVPRLQDPGGWLNPEST